MKVEALAYHKDVITGQLGEVGDQVGAELEVGMSSRGLMHDLKSNSDFMPQLGVPT
jgi:hypothetical protein